jgi:hypothetical protein
MRRAAVGPDDYVVQWDKSGYEEILMEQYVNRSRNKYATLQEEVMMKNLLRGLAPLNEVAATLLPSLEVGTPCMWCGELLTEGIEEHEAECAG